MRYASTVLLRGAWALAAEHRGWLKTAVEGLLTRQHCEGTWCAFKEELSHPGWGGSTRVPDNADYGTFEAPLNQANDDPVSDFLYTSNFALLGLHEAAAALGDPAISAPRTSAVGRRKEKEAESGANISGRCLIWGRVE